MIDTLLADLRYALRVLRRSPGFTTVAILTLALGIGANTATFSLMSAVLFRPLPFADPERLASLVKHFQPSDRGQMHLDPPSVVDWTAETTLFEGTALIAGGAMNLSTADRPEHVDGSRITTGTFDLLGVRPVLGRSFFAEEARPGRDHVVILSDALWRQRFAVDSQVLGRQLLMDGIPYTVIGVMPPGFAFPDQDKFWLPLAFDSGAGRGDNWVTAIVRLRPGVTRARVDAYLATVSRRLQQQYPASNTGVWASVAPLRRVLLGGGDPKEARAILSLMLGAVGLVLLIVCANLANLLLARASARHREIAIRAALGASRRRIVTQLLTETGVVALAGGGLGVLLTLWTLGPFQAAIQAHVPIPYWMRFTVDWRGLLFTGIVSLATGAAVGALPAFGATRLDLRASLQDGGRAAGAGGGARAGPWRNAFVVAQVAVTMVLLMAAGLLIRTVVGLEKADPGFETAHAFTARVPLGGVRYDSARVRGAFLNEFTRRVEALPGVTAVGAINILPLGFTNWEGVRVEGREDSSHSALLSSVAGHILPALGVSLREGRGFSETEAELGEPLAVINATMARRYWAGESPLGRRIRFGRGPWLSIVGVAADIKQGRLEESGHDQVYIPYGKRYSWSTMSIVVRTAGDPSAAVAMVRAELGRMDSTIPLSDVSMMREIVDRSFWQQRLFGSMFSGLAAAALLLAAIGIYGVMAYAVALRTHEIGVRLALGAERADVLRLVLRQGGVLTALGVGVGIVGAWGATRALGSMLYGVGPMDPVSLLATTVLLSGVALLACLLPARRATKVDPMVALRAE